MALKQLAIQVKSFNGQCDTTCSECTAVQGITIPENTTNGSGIIEGSIVPNESGNSIWTSGCFCYVNFEFDDAQLVDPDNIDPCDICLVCGCIIDLISRQGFTLQDVFGGSAFVGPFEVVELEGTGLASIVVSEGSPNNVTVDVPCSAARTCFSGLDTPSVNYTYNPATGIHSADVKISADAGNDIEIRADGLFVNIEALCSEIRGCFSGLDTPTIDYTYNSSTGVHSAAVKISATAGNNITANADGIYAPTPAAETPLTVNDTSTVDLTASGTANHTLSAAVKVSATAGNTLSVNADGLYVNVPAQTPVTVVDTSTVDLTASGTNSHTITAVVKISATAGNTLSVNADGLYVNVPTQTPITANDTSSIDLTASGTDNHTLSGVVIISPDANNLLVTNGNGLFVQAVNAVNTGSGCTAVGSSSMVRSFGISGNTLSITSAPEHTSSAVHAFTLTGASGDKFEGDEFTGSTHTTLFNNPSSCRSIAVVIVEQVEFNLGQMLDTTNANAAATANVEYQIRDGIGNTFPMADIYNIPANFGANKIGYHITKPTNAYTIAASGSVTFDTIPYFKVSKTNDPDVKVSFGGMTARTLLMASTV